MLVSLRPSYHSVNLWPVMRGTLQIGFNEGSTVGLIWAVGRDDPESRN